MAFYLHILSGNVSHYKKKWAIYDKKCSLVVMKIPFFLMKLEFCQQVFEKSLIMKFNDNPFIRSRVVPRGWTGQTGRRLIFALCNFANSPKSIESMSGGLNWWNCVLFMHKIRHCYKVKMLYQTWEFSIFIVYKFSYIYRTNVMQLDSMFISNCNNTLHVSDAFSVHPQEYLKTVVTASGLWHETGWSSQ